MNIQILLWLPLVLLLLPCILADGEQQKYLAFRKEKVLIIWGSQRTWLFLRTGEKSSF